MVNGQWSMVNGQWSTVNGQRSMVNGQRSTVNGQRSTVNGQWSTVNGQWSMVNGQRSMVNGQWSMMSLHGMTEHSFAHTALITDTIVSKILVSAKNGLKGQYAHSPGHRPGLIVTKNVRPERAKALKINAFALSGRLSPPIFTQGDALGYVVIGLSGRS